MRVSSHIDGHRHPCLYRPFRILDDHFCFQEEELPRSRKSPNFFSAILDYMNTLCQSAHRVDRFCAPFTKVRNGGVHDFENTVHAVKKSHLGTSFSENCPALSVNGTVYAQSGTGLSVFGTGASIFHLCILHIGYQLYQYPSVRYLATITVYHLDACEMSVAVRFFVYRSFSWS